MALGYRIVEPSGKVRFLQAETREKANELVRSVANKWLSYCEDNWINDNGGIYTPEVKVKRLLDSLAYYMLLGHTDGIETDYRRVMHAKREIPLSSCPKLLDNLMYSTSGGTDAIEQDEISQFNDMLDRLDAKAKRYEVPKKTRKKIESGQHKRRRLGIRGGEWLVVDTDGKFWFDHNQYVIDDQEVQYAPVETEYGLYYAMDRILASGGKFYDMNFDEVSVHRIGGIMPYDIFASGC